MKTFTFDLQRFATINKDGNVTIVGSDGNDLIQGFNETSTLKIGDGDGDDYISNFGSFVSILAGKGNDQISLSSASKNNFIRYFLGDGNDLIQGFDKNSRLQIDGEYSVETVDSDIVITVGKGSITLKDAASLETININGEEVSVLNYEWVLNNAVATYGNQKETLVTVSNVKSLDELVIDTENKTVTVSNVTVNGKKITVSDGYKLALDSGVTTPKIISSTWSLSGTTASYNRTTAAGYTLANNTITYSKATTETLATIEGAKNKNALTVTGETIKPAAASLSKKVTISGNYAYEFASDYTEATITGSKTADTITANGNNILIDGGEGNDQIVSGGVKVTINGGAGNDRLWGGSGNDTFIYTTNEGLDTIFDFSAGDMLKILNPDSTNGKYSKAAFASGTLTLTIDGGGTVIFNNVKTGDTLNINGTTRTIIGKTLK